MTNNFKRLFLYSTAVIMFSSSNALAAKGDFTNFFKALRNNSYNGMVYNFDSSFVNAKDTSGKTPLGYALSHNNANMTEFLLRNGANPSTIEANGEPAFCNAKHTRNAYIKKQLNGYNFEVCKGTFFHQQLKP